MSKEAQITTLIVLIFVLVFCSYAIGFRSGEDYMFGGSNYVTINGSIPRNITNFWIK